MRRLASLYRTSFAFTVLFDERITHGGKPGNIGYGCGIGLRWLDRHCFVARCFRPLWFGAPRRGVRRLLRP